MPHRMTPLETSSPLPLRQESAAGILAMALGMFLYSAVDTQAKLLTETLHPLQIVWVRQLGLLAVALVLISRHGPGVMKTANPGLQILRGALAAGSAALFITAVAFVPLADAVAVSFVTPFIVTMLGAWLLGEAIGVRRWIAVTLGFIGTLIVLRPGLGAVHPAAFLVLVAAMLFATRQVISRYLSNRDPLPTTLAYTGIASIAVLTIPLPFVWQWPATGEEYALLFGAALLAGIAETLVIRAAIMAEAVVIAPVMYTLIIWGTLYGYLVFGDLPDLWTWIGTAIIVATGLYTLWRERLAERRRTSSNIAK